MDAMKWVCLAALMSLGAVVPAAARDVSPCGCWYQGFEDGLEFPWGERNVAEGYQPCADGGYLRQYEAGFKASTERAERQCPYEAAADGSD